MSAATIQDPADPPNARPLSLRKPAHKRLNPRPQRLHSWFNLVPIAEYEAERPARILFLDTFVTIERKDVAGETRYRVLFEGQREMTSVVEIGILFVWYGDDLATPDRHFPNFFSEKYDSAYVSSTATLFEDTHVMDFVENGSDNLHFGAVHLWEYSKIYDHEVTPDAITLKQDTRFKYGSCSTQRSIRMISKVLPRLELTQDYVYHGPGLAIVGATGSRTPRMHALVSLTPEGDYRTRVYVTLAIDPTTFPQWAESAYQRIFPGKKLCDLLARVMANFIRNEFDIDAIIWANKKYVGDGGLLPSEKVLREVIRWGTTFYPKDFEPPIEESKSIEERRWLPLIALDAVAPGKVHRFSIADRELIARRDATGALHVFDAFCPHQGAHLGHGGRIDDDCIRCPFHGFYFDAEGRCIGPNIDNKQTFIQSLNLTPIEHRIAQGQVEVYV
jgi:nitrite reductase/ring-hydroxylating ferredoxin subunit